MASAIDAIRNITSDSLWFIKIAILAIPIYLYFTDNTFVARFFGTDIVFFVAMTLLYLGVSSVLINRNLHNKVPILPSFFSVFDVIRRSICSTIVALPSLFILFVVLYYFNTYFSYLNSIVLTIANAAIIIILFPFVCIPIVIYSVNGKITDLFRAKKIQSASGDFIVSLITFIIQYIFTVALFTYLVYAAFKSFYGENFIGIPILFSFVITFSFLMIFSWASDLYENVIPVIEEKPIKIEPIRNEPRD